MGFRDKVQQIAAEQEQTAQARQAATAAVVGLCPDPGKHYLTEVNKGSIRMQTWQAHLNDLFRQGYRLAHVLEQDGNTVQVFEHHHP